MIVCLPLDTDNKETPEQYHALIDFLVSKSDSFSVALQEYSNEYISEYNYDMFDFLGKNINNIGEKVDFNDDEKEADEHYFKHCEPFLNRLKPYIIEEFCTTNVYGYITHAIKHVKRIALNEETVKILHEFNSLSDWERTAENEGYPGDLCFHKDGKLVFSCFCGDVSGEVFTNKRSDCKILKNIWGKVLIKNLSMKKRTPID